MALLINFDIPHTMTKEGLRYLAKMAKTVPENGVIVEVGPLFGSSTWVLAKNSHPSVKVYSIDTWERAPWIEEIEKKFPGCVPFSKDSFLHYTSDCDNVIPIQGWSPDVVVDSWEEDIDMFFDDASHGNPGFINNLNFFVPRVKAGGIVCGDDYAKGWPDIVREVDVMADQWSSSPEVIGRVWSLIKPGEGVNAKSVYDTLPSDCRTVPNVRFEIQSKSGRTYNSSPDAWAGALHKVDPIAKIKPVFDSGFEDIDLQLGFRTSFGDIKLWSSKDSAEQEVSVAEGEFIVGMFGSLAGAAANSKELTYQMGGCDLAKGRLASNSRNHLAPSMLSLEDGQAANAVRVFIR